MLIMDATSSSVYHTNTGIDKSQLQPKSSDESIDTSIISSQPQPLEAAAARLLPVDKLKP